MPTKNTLFVYGSVAKFFHWLTVLLVLTMLAIGFIMTGMSKSDPDTLRLYGLHKSIGATILVITLLRLLWRQWNPVPLLPEHMSRFERLAAHASHALLYMLLIGMPMSGWLMSSAAGFQVSVFGLFRLPNLIAPDRGLFLGLKQTHDYLAYVILAAVSVHALAALVHHFYYKDNVLRRMLPFVKS